MRDSDDDWEPWSNAAEVAGRLATQTIDLDGSGLVDFFRLLAARAEDIVALGERGEAFKDRALAGRMADQAEINAELQEAIYDPLCLRWFLSRAALAIAEELAHQVRDAQAALRPVRRIVFAADGRVESYAVEPPGK